MITNICPYTDAIKIDCRENEVTLIKQNDWVELFFDTKEDIDIFINDLVAARDKVFKKTNYQSCVKDIPAHPEIIRNPDSWLKNSMNLPRYE